MSTSQHYLVEELLEIEQQNNEVVHACTDITGFGLLGHMREMINHINTQNDFEKVVLDLDEIPSLPGAIELLEKGIFSSLAASNREELDKLESNESLIKVKTNLLNKKRINSILELIIDPQTCGPLLISLPPLAAQKLSSRWTKIGVVI